MSRGNRRNRNGFTNDQIEFFELLQTFALMKGIQLEIHYFTPRSLDLFLNDFARYIELSHDRSEAANNFRISFEQCLRNVVHNSRRGGNHR